MLTALIIFILIGSSSPVLSKHHHFYRRDYTYVEEYDAYYKLHWDSSGWSWNSAFMACDNEGAKLFYPKGDEWTLVKNLSKAMKTPPNITEMYVGLHNEFGLGEFITVDGKPTESPLNVELEIDASEGSDRCMLMDYTTGQFRESGCFVTPDSILPYVCKKVDDKSCPTIDHEYSYVKEANRCYKVNKRPKTWQAAMQTCHMEGGILAVLDDATYKDLYLMGERRQKYFIGLKKSFSSRDFYTVKGQKYQSPELQNWSQQFPSHDCGIISNEYSPPQVSAEMCSSELPFICEMGANI